MKTFVPRVPGFVLTAVSVLVIVPSAFAVDLLVYNNNDSGPGSLRQAIIDNNASAGGNRIVFSNTVTGTITLTSGQLFVEKSLAIIGPGPTLLAINGNYPNTTNRVFEVRDEHITIANLTITNGNFVGGVGGGILNFKAVLTVSNCVISGNSASSGGGIYNNSMFSNGIVTVISSTLSGNVANRGGAVYNSGISGHATFSALNSSFISNRADYVPVVMSGGVAAGIYNDGRNEFGSATLTVSNCTFRGNIAAESAGGIYNDGSSSGTAIALVDRSTFYSNSAAILYGGGILNYGILSPSFSGTASVTVNDSTFTGNFAGAGGGLAGYGFDGRATNWVKRCTFEGNAAQYYGGGIYQEGLNVNCLVNASTFSGNFANESGGAIGSYYEGAVTLANSTLSGNWANGSGDAIAVENAYLDIASTILKGRTTGTTITNNLSLVTSSGYNLSSDNGDGVLTNATDLINTEPLLGPIANNGGPTMTHALLSASPAIDRGKNFSGPYDQRGEPRPIDFAALPNPAGGDGSDIGAFEVGPRPPLHIAQVGGNAVLSWPVYYDGFTLQSTTNVTASNSWITAAGNAGAVGNQYQQTNGTISGNRYFRLRN
jgi:hypothetical protein